MLGKKILLVEDNERVNEFNKRLLTKQGFLVTVTATLAEARASFAQNRPEIIILDIGMPDGSGLDFLRELRQTCLMPVLLLTGNGKNQDIELGFQNGCSDYLTKPYSFGVLLARINNLLRSAERLPEQITKGLLVLKTVPMTAYLNDRDLGLSQKEFSLLMLFIQNQDHALSATQLYEQIWGQPMAGDDNAVKVMVSRLRTKLGESGYTITTRRGEGYCFEIEN